MPPLASSSPTRPPKVVSLVRPETASAELLKLHLGCGYRRQDGWVNADLYPTPATDVTFDACARWPFADAVVGYCYASHVLEHLPDPKAFFREAWRVLQPHGSMLLRLPYGGHRSAWWDLEHLRPWFAENFCFLQPGYALAIGNPQHEAWAWPFGIERIDLRLSGGLTWWCQRRWRRRLLVKGLEYLAGAVEELWVYLFALKRAEDVAQYQQTHEAHVVPARYVIYRHQLEDRGLRPGEGVELVPVAEPVCVNGYRGYRCG